jgi:uncharacterized protein YkwD
MFLLGVLSCKSFVAQKSSCLTKSEGGKDIRIETEISNKYGFIDTSVYYEVNSFVLEFDSIKMTRFQSYLAKAMFTETNNYRKKYGLPALTWLDPMEKAAQLQCNYMNYESDWLDSLVLCHEQTNVENPFFIGTEISDRVNHFTPNKKWFFGENVLCSGIIRDEYDGSTSEGLKKLAGQMAHKFVFENWHNSPGHRDNMLDKTFRTLGTFGTIRDKRAKERFPDCNGNMVNYNEPASYYLLFGCQVFGL